MNQDIILVIQDEKFTRLLTALEKTAPPTLVFSSYKGVVDELHIFLLVKGVEVTALHGGLHQGEREEAMSQFLSGKTDVLVASDLASIGLDFTEVQHVINFEVPAKIDIYLRRLGSARSCRFSTTFVTSTSTNLTTLYELRELLIKDNQIVPSFLAELPAGKRPSKMKKIENLCHTQLASYRKQLPDLGRRAGEAMNQDIILVRQEEKFTRLLTALDKTAPPALVFSNHKAVVDDLHIYLLVKGVEVTALHGDLQQCEREEAMSLFISGKKDVLVASDLASIGLDFSEVQHVINFDVPANIEIYSRRLGCARRCRFSTTFVTSTSTNLTTLYDLRDLLIKDNQTIPSFLAELPAGARPARPPKMKKIEKFYLDGSY